MTHVHGDYAAVRRHTAKAPDGAGVADGLTCVRFSARRLRPNHRTVPWEGKKAAICQLPQLGGPGPRFGEGAGGGDFQN